MLLPLPPPTPLQPLRHALLEQHGVEVLVKREDLSDPWVSGNKWRKLRYNLEEAYQQGFRRILTFGGAYSNHILATAAAGQRLGFETIGMIRGEETLPLNSTLQFAQQAGMQLVYVSREAYRNRQDPHWLQELATQFSPCFIVPEGGSNRFALPGVAEMVNELPPCQYVCTACGTGGTLAGILAGLQGRGMAIGVPVLKGGAFIKNEVEQLLQEAGYGQYSNFDLLTDYHFGGYAKTKPELLHFIEHFGQKHGIPLEPIYTGKMFFALFDAIEKGYFERGSTIVAVHTGGLRPTSW